MNITGVVAICMLLQEVYKQCEVAIVVYDVTNHNSLRAAKHWITNIKAKSNNFPTQILLVANKVALYYCIKK